ncbi:MAG: hypothetical protein WBJ58_00880 [Syntrophales bacterium]
MKWVNGETDEHKRERLAQWHRWFAWYPVTLKIEDGHRIKIWLEWVERKINITYPWGEKEVKRTYKEIVK